MSLVVRAVIRCEAPRCGRSVSLEGPSSVNAEGVRDIARYEYGWQVVKGRERCFAHRTRPLAFHAFEADNADGYGRCAVSLRGDRRHWSRVPEHHEEVIRRNAAELEREHFAEWTQRR